MRQSTGIVAVCIPLLFIIASCATQAPRPDTPPSGSALYAANCANCHGRYADGMGPVSSDMAIPDLRYLAADNGGVFPGTEIVSVIDGRSTVKAHSARQMPVWGDAFTRMEGSNPSAQAHVTAKIQALVAYIETIQQSR